jgi:hypothetical protein
MDRLLETSSTGVRNASSPLGMQLSARHALRNTKQSIMGTNFEFGIIIVQVVCRKGIFIIP